MLVGRDQIVAGRNLKHSIKERAHLMAAAFEAVIDRLRIPLGRHAGGKQSLHFRRYVESLLVESVEQRLDAEAVAAAKIVRFLSYQSTKANSPATDAGIACQDLHRDEAQFRCLNTSASGDPTVRARAGSPHNHKILRLPRSGSDCPRWRWCQKVDSFIERGLQK
jgi:hypothetical protein